MKVFITGISGFVGAGIARQFVSKGMEVHGLIRPSSNMWRIADIQHNLNLHTGDLLDDESVREAITISKPDTILHLGVYGAYPSRQKEKDLIVKSTLLSTMTLLDIAKENGVKMFVNTGSSSEYGTKDHPMREDELIEPNSYYAVGKASQTLYCQQFAREEKLPTVTLRLFSVYGPYEEPTRFIPTLLSKVQKNEDVPLADPSIQRDFIYIDDVAEAYLAVMNKPELSGHIFNIGSGKGTSLQEAFDTAVRLTDSASKPIVGAYERRGFDTNIWVGDIRNAREAFGFNPRHTLETGLKATSDWMRVTTV